MGVARVLKGFLQYLASRPWDRMAGSIPVLARARTPYRSDRCLPESCSRRRPGAYVSDQAGLIYTSYPIDLAGLSCRVRASASRSDGSAASTSAKEAVGLDGLAAGGVQDIEVEGELVLVVLDRPHTKHPRKEEDDASRAVRVGGRDGCVVRRSRARNRPKPSPRLCRAPERSTGSTRPWTNSSRPTP